MRFQMDFQLLSGMLVKIWGEFPWVPNWPILTKKAWAIAHSFQSPCWTEVIVQAFRYFIADLWPRMNYLYNYFLEISRFAGSRGTSKRLRMLFSLYSAGDKKEIKLLNWNMFFWNVLCFTFFDSQWVFGYYSIMKQHRNIKDCCSSPLLSD